MMKRLAVVALAACAPADAGPQKAVCEQHLLWEPDPNEHYEGGGGSTAEELEGVEPAIAFEPRWAE